MKKINKIINTLNALAIFLSTIPVFANGDSVQYINYNYGIFAFTAGFTIALSVISGTLSQGMAAKATLEGITRNPESAGKVFVPMILAFALIESLVLFSLLIALTIVGKIS
jgi:F0F1-type ATP synthase membrane subunit c/vacuolar-type H+-ATPase subunit K